MNGQPWISPCGGLLFLVVLPSMEQPFPAPPNRSGRSNETAKVSAWADWERPRKVAPTADPATTLRSRDPRRLPVPSAARRTAFREWIVAWTLLRRVVEVKSGKNADAVAAKASAAAGRRISRWKANKNTKARVDPLQNSVIWERSGFLGVI